RRVAVEVDSEQMCERSGAGARDGCWRRCEQGRHGCGSKTRDDCRIRCRIVGAHLPNTPALVKSCAALSAYTPIPGPIRIEHFAFRVLRAGECFFKRGDLDCGQTCDPLRALAGDRVQFRTHNSGLACWKVIDNAVFQAVESVAGGQNSLSREIEILVRKSFVQERLAETIVDALCFCDFCHSLSIQCVPE